MFRAHLAAGIVAAGLLAVSGCGKHPDPWHEAKPGQKNILAVTPALYCFATNVAGDKGAVLCLLSNTGPHDYEYNPADAIKARRADLFLANGLELDDFVKRISNDSGNTALKPFKVADELEHADLLHPDHDHEAGGHAHVHGEHDPHVWLSPVLAEKLSKIIANKLAALDPGNKAVYDKNQQDFARKLKTLLDEGRAALAKKKNKNIVTMHDAMAYFGDAFDVEIVDTIMAKAGHGVEAKRLAMLVDRCKKKDVRVLCVEPQYPKAAAETLQKALKDKGIAVKIIEFDPLETVASGETLDADYYLRRMRHNIEQLLEALP